MFKDINVEKTQETNLSKATKISNDSIKKVLVKSRIKNISKNRK